MASILFLAPADLGEAVLATGALDFARSEDGALTVVCTPEAASLYRAAPGLIALHTIAPDMAPFARFSLWSRLAQVGFDLVVDGRGGLLGATIPALRRVTLSTNAPLRHRAEAWAETLGAPHPLAPRLWVDAGAREAAVGIAAAPLIVLAPGGLDGAKRWAPERFAAVARRLAGGPLAGAGVVVLSAAPRDAEIVRAIISSLDADGVAARAAGAELDLLGAAALMERATIVLGNDNALTHLAAAAGAPVLTLFGPTDERVRAPYGPRARTLRGRDLADYAALDASVAMEDVSIDAVEAACLDLLHAGGLA